MTAEKVIERFSEIARPMMLQFMTRESCIAAARTTIETMRRFSLRAEPRPVCYALQIPARKYARVSGFSIEEQQQMKGKAETWIELPIKGWNGHLLVLVEDRWVIDPAIDQASNATFGVHIEPMILVMDTRGHEFPDKEKFDMQLGLTLDSGESGTLFYRSLEDQSYLETEAWNDEGLPFLANVIAGRMQLDPYAAEIDHKIDHKPLQK